MIYRILLGFHPRVAYQVATSATNNLRLIYEEYENSRQYLRRRLPENRKIAAAAEEVIELEDKTVDERMLDDSWIVEGTPVCVNKDDVS